MAEEEQHHVPINGILLLLFVLKEGLTPALSITLFVQACRVVLKENYFIL